MKSRHFPFLLALCAALLSLAPSARALHPQISKLSGKSSASRANNEFGTSVAVTERWIAVGDPGHAEKGAGAGAVHIFDARNGRYVRRIFGDDTGAGDSFGTSVAVCGNRLVVGAPNRTDGAGFSGAAYLFDLARGQQIAKLTPETPEAFDFFGFSVAISDAAIVVGATGGDGMVDDTGTITLFDPRDGARLDYDPTGLANVPFIPNDGATGDEFGSAVALCGNLLFVGAPAASSDAGKVYLFDLATGLRIRTTANPGGANAARFGAALSAEGGLLAVGAPNDDEIASGAGAGYLYDAVTGVLRGKLTNPGGQAGDALGGAVSISGGLGLIGAREADGFQGNTGSAYLVDAASGSLLATLQANDGKTNDFYGAAVAICGNVAVVGAPGTDSTLEGPDLGSVYFHRPVGGPLPMMTLAKTRDFAPGTEEADFRILRDAGINGDGEVIFCGQLMGPGSGGGRDKGIWHTIEGSVDLAVKSRDDLGALGPEFTGARATNLYLPVMNAGNRGIFQSRLAGPGVNGTNNLALLQYHEGLGVSSLLRTGTDIALLDQGAGPPRLQVFREVLQTANFDNVSVSYLLRRGPGGVTPANDTGILSVSSSGVVTDVSAREGESNGDGGTLRQFFGRAAVGRSNYVNFGAFHVPDGGTRPEQGLFYDEVGGPGDVSADSSTPVPGGGAEEFFRAFTGETNDTDGYALYRAIVAGNGATGANNEGLWDEETNRNLYRKGSGVEFGPDPNGGSPGDLPQLEDGVVIHRILKFWPVGSDGTITLVKLRGPGVNGSNDCALFFHDATADVYLRLMREGDPVCDWDCPKVRAIQRVEVHPQDGRYVIVAALTGSPRRNQALFTGQARFGLLNTQSALRLPQMKLRKGTLYDSGFSQATTLRSILLRESTDRTGAGGKGLSHSINNNGEVVLDLQFDNGARELVVGQP